MTRPLMALIVTLCFLSPAFPAPSSPPGTLSTSEKDRAPGSGKDSPRVVAPSDEYVFTAESEVLLDGRPYRYEDVPAGAVITSLQVAPDRRTIVRIHFRSPK